MYIIDPALISDFKAAMLTNNKVKKFFESPRYIKNPNNNDNDIIEACLAKINKNKSYF